MVGLADYHYLARSRIIYVLTALMQIDEVGEAFALGRDAGDIGSLVAYYHRHLAAVQEPHVLVRDVVVLPHLFHEILLPVLVHVLAEHDRDVVEGYLVELVVRDL